MARDIEELSRELAQLAPCEREVRFHFGGCRIAVALNAPELEAWLVDYYRAFDDPQDEGPADFRVRVHQLSAPFDTGLEFRAWEREPGKSLGKEAFFDLDDGRVVRKVRTGMQFLVSRNTLVAFGDCLANANQIVNFINFQLTSWLMNRGFVLCHAAGIVQGGRGLAMASYSGGGKSTLALQLMARGASFCSNDRVLVEREGERHTMVGVPKHPRINPGTILGNPRLHSILDSERRRALEGMPLSELWSLEEKYDARVDRLFGDHPAEMRASLDALLILDWKPGGEEPCTIESFSLRETPHWLDAIVKSPGPFYIPAAGAPPTGYEPPQKQPYLEALAGLPAYVARGGADFETAIAFCRSLLGVE